MEYHSNADNLLHTNELSCVCVVIHFKCRIAAVLIIAQMTTCQRSQTSIRKPSFQNTSIHLAKIHNQNPPSCHFEIPADCFSHSMFFLCILVDCFDRCKAAIRFYLFCSLAAVSIWNVYFSAQTRFIGLILIHPCRPIFTYLNLIFG